MLDTSAHMAASQALNCIIAMDICTIGLIKDKERVLRGNDEYKKKRLRDILSMAKTGRYKFSFILSIIEKATDLEHQMSLKEMITRFEKDYRVLVGMLGSHNMRENTKILKKLIKIIMDENYGIEERAEINIHLYHDLLNYYNNLGIKKDPEPPSQRLVFAKQITDYAQELGIARGHPVTAICVASIYGCAEARHILKINNKGEFNSSNALGDIMSFYRIAKTRYQIMTNIPGMRIEFRTEDKGLGNMHAFYSATVTDVIDDTPLLSVFNIDDKRMFPRLVSKANGLNKKERDELYAMLNFRKPD